MQCWNFPLPLTSEQVAPSTLSTRIFGVCWKEGDTVSGFTEIHGISPPPFEIIENPFIIQPVRSSVQPNLLREMLENGICVAFSPIWLFLPPPSFLHPCPGIYQLSLVITALAAAECAFNVGALLQAYCQVTFRVTFYGTD